MNKQLTPNDIKLARNVAWAEKQKLHPIAIEYARKYVNLDHQWLRLISAYEEAFDYTHGEYRDKALREAFGNVIAYARTFPSHKQEADGE